MSNAPAGWYPDAEAPGGMRYWDGTLWTEHRHMPAPVSAPGVVPQQAPQPNSPRPRRTGLVIGLIAGGAALAMGLVAVFAWGIPAWTADPHDLSQLTTRPIVHSDDSASYDYTEPVSGIEDRTQDILFRTDFDPYTKPDWADPDDIDNTWAFRVFSDAALSVLAPASVSAIGAERGFRISSHEPTTAEVAGGVDEFTIRHLDAAADSGRGGWGLRDNYYLVRYIDAGGNKLERPVVSQFSFVRDLPVPDVVFSVHAEKPSALGLSWKPVEGAESYLIVKKATPQEFADLPSYTLIGETSATEWGGDEAFDPRGMATSFGDYGYSLYQNYQLEFFETSEDEALDGGDVFSRTVGNEYGVIAVGSGDEGTIMSPIGAIRADEVSASLPYTLAENTFRELHTGSGFWRNEYGNVDQIPAVLPLVNLGGSVVAATAHMLPTPLSVNGTRYAASLTASGSDLGFWVAFQAGSDAEFAAAVESFNARAVTDALPTGTAASYIRDIITEAEPVREAPDTELAMFQGSHPFVDFLALHFVAGTRAIDLSEWIGRPGLPDVYDAAYEAIHQTGWAFIDGISLNGNILSVAYYYPSSDLADRQNEIAEKVSSLVDELIDDGMSDTEKVAAINDHLLGTVAYDYEALDASAGGMYVPELYAYAWTAEGALLSGDAVCQGYSVAFMLLAREAGLEVVQVTGNISAINVRHAWNKVKVDGEWRSIDVTWNDSPNQNRYLLISDDEFTDDAARTEDTAWMLDLDVSRYATS